jgi:hypothetical protein
MKRYLIEWRGTITRDVGTVTVEAEDRDHAREVFATYYPTYRIESVQLAECGHDADELAR